MVSKTPLKKYLDWVLIDSFNRTSHRDLLEELTAQEALLIKAFLNTNCDQENPPKANELLKRFCVNLGDEPLTHKIALKVLFFLNGFSDSDYNCTPLVKDLDDRHRNLLVFAGKVGVCRHQVELMRILCKVYRSLFLFIIMIFMLLLLIQMTV